jgi:outer membrane lipoprotein-sorting protein
MVPDNPRAALSAVTLGSLVVLSGLGIGGVAAQQPSVAQSIQTPEKPSEAPGDGNESTSDGDDIVASFEERIESLETLVMTYETNVTGENFTTTTERTMWVDYENDRIRTETHTNRTDVVTVRNESRTVTYDAENEQVNRYETPDGDVARTPVDGLVEDTNITYEGRERLDGEQTYRLDVTRPNATGLSTSVDTTVWIDADTYFPTKAAVEAENGDFNVTMHFRNVSLNASISDDRFTIDVPEDAEESSYDLPDVTEYDSLSELRDEANRSVPAPDVPAAYSFEKGYVTEGDAYHSTTLRYTTGDGETLSIAQVSAGEYDYNYSDSDRYESVSIGNHTGYYTEYEFAGNTTTVVALPCGETTYTVSGDLDRQQTIEVAESLHCDA